MHNTLSKVPLFHITRRKELPWYRAWLIRVIAVILGLVLCGIVSMLLVKINPLNVYKTMLSGAFGTVRRIWVTAQNMAILLGISLALAPAFKMRFWNLGGDGQTLMGVLGATAPMILLGGKVPNILLLLIMLVCAIIGGAIWALIPAAFKAKWNTNETLCTLMMNYIAIELVDFFVIICYRDLVVTFEVTVIIVLGHHKLHLHKMTNLINVVSVQTFPLIKCSPISFPFLGSPILLDTILKLN